jgi:two-component system, LuxR family, sensor kinase FixL
VEVSCWADGFRLEQAFRNLFENALEACPDPVRIDICCSETIDNGTPVLRLVVRDNGPGMTGEQRRMAFDRCYTTKSKGTGLGLAIVKRIFEAHGGSITIGPAAQEPSSSSILPLQPK